MGQDKFFCFDCMDTFEFKTIEYHTVISCNKVNKFRENTSRKPRSQLKKIMKTYSEFKKFYVIVDDKDNQVKCLTCGKKVDAWYESMLQHKNKHVGGIVNLVDHGKRRHDLATYGRLHYIRLNRSGSWGHCFLCNVVFSASIHQAINHVQGEHHKTCLRQIELQTPTARIVVPLKTIGFLAFLNQVHRIFDDFFTHEFRREISFDSFMLVTPYGFDNKHLCNVCNEIILSYNIYEHCNTETHLHKMLDCVVITDPCLKREFVRMVRQDIYHCGICNLIYPSWALMARHLKGVKHLVRKKSTAVMQLKASNMHRKQNAPYHENIREHFTRLGFTYPQNVCRDLNVHSPKLLTEKE